MELVPTSPIEDVAGSDGTKTREAPQPSGSASSNDMVPEPEGTAPRFHLHSVLLTPSSPQEEAPPDTSSVGTTLPARRTRPLAAGPSSQAALATDPATARTSAERREGSEDSSSKRAKTDADVVHIAAYAAGVPPATVPTPPEPDRLTKRQKVEDDTELVPTPPIEDVMEALSASPRADDDRCDRAPSECPSTSVASGSPTIFPDDPNASCEDRCRWVRFCFEARIDSEPDARGKMEAETMQVFPAHVKNVEFEDQFRTQLVRLISDESLSFDRTCELLFDRKVTKPQHGKLDEDLWSQYVRWALQFAPEEQVPTDPQQEELDSDGEPGGGLSQGRQLQLAMDVCSITGRTYIIPTGTKVLDDIQHQLSQVGVEWTPLLKKSPTQPTQILKMDFSPEVPTSKENLIKMGLGTFADAEIHTRRSVSRTQLQPMLAKMVAKHSSATDPASVSAEINIKLHRICPYMYGQGGHIAEMVTSAAIEGRKGTLYVPTEGFTVAPFDATAWMAHQGTSSNPFSQRVWSELLSTVFHRGTQFRDMGGAIPVDALAQFDAAFTPKAVATTLALAALDRDASQPSRGSHQKRWMKLLMWVMVPQADLKNDDPFANQVPFLIESAEMEESYPVPERTKPAKYTRLPNLDLRGPAIDGTFVQQFPKLFHFSHFDNLVSIIESGIMPDWEQKCRNVKSKRTQAHPKAGRAFVGLSRGDRSAATNPPGDQAEYSMQIEVDLAAFVRDARAADQSIPIIVSPAGDVYVAGSIGNQYFLRIDVVDHNGHCQTIWDRTSTPYRIPTPPHNNNFQSASEWITRLHTLNKTGDIPLECSNTYRRFCEWDVNQRREYEQQFKNLRQFNSSRPHDAFLFHQVDEMMWPFEERANFQKMDSIWCNKCHSLMPKPLLVCPMCGITFEFIPFKAISMAEHSATAASQAAPQEGNDAPNSVVRTREWEKRRKRTKESRKMTNKSMHFTPPYCKICQSTTCLNETKHTTNMPISASTTEANRQRAKQQNSRVAMLVKQWRNNAFQRALHAACGGTAQAIEELTVPPWIPAHADSVPPVATEWENYMLSKLCRVRDRIYKAIDLRFKEMEDAEDKCLETSRVHLSPEALVDLQEQMKRMRDLRRHEVVARVLPQLWKGFVQLMPKTDFTWGMMQVHVDRDEWEFLEDKNYSDQESNGMPGDSSYPPPSSLSPAQKQEREQQRKEAKKRRIRAVASEQVHEQWAERRVAQVVDDERHRAIQDGRMTEAALPKKEITPEPSLPILDCLQDKRNLARRSPSEPASVHATKHVRAAQEPTRMSTPRDDHAALAQKSERSSSAAEPDEDPLWPKWGVVWAAQLSAEQQKEAKEQAIAAQKAALDAQAIAKNRATRAHDDVPDEEIQRTGPRDLRPLVIEPETRANNTPSSAPWRTGSREPRRTVPTPALFDRTKISWEHKDLCRRANTWKKVPWAKREWDRRFGSVGAGKFGLQVTEDPARISPKDLKEYVAWAEAENKWYTGERDQGTRRSSPRHEQRQRSYPPWRGQGTQSYKRTASKQRSSVQQQTPGSRDHQRQAYVDPSINYRGRGTTPRTLHATHHPDARVNESRERRSSTSSRPSASAANEISWNTGWSTDTGSQKWGSSGSAGEEREAQHRRWQNSNQRGQRPATDARRSQPQRGAYSQPPSAAWWNRPDW